jgi:hypothetical protein
MLGIQSDVEIGAERSGYFFGEERAKAAPGDPAHHLSDEKPLGDRVVSGRSARHPSRRLRGEPGGCRRPVVQPFDRAFPVRQARRMGEQVPHEHVLFSRGGELRPVPGNRRVKVKHAAIGQDQCTQRGHRLGDRPHVDDRVPLPRDRAAGVSEPAPDIHHGLTVHVDGHRPARISLIEQSAQHRGDRREQDVA